MGAAASVAPAPMSPAYSKGREVEGCSERPRKRWNLLQFPEVLNLLLLRACGQVRLLLWWLTAELLRELPSPSFGSWGLGEKFVGGPLSSTACELNVCP